MLTAHLPAAPLRLLTVPTTQTAHTAARLWGKLRVLVAVGDGPLSYTHFALSSLSLSLFSHRARTVLAVKGPLRRVQQRRALDRSWPFQKTLPDKREKLDPDRCGHCRCHSNAAIWACSFASFAATVISRVWCDILYDLPVILSGGYGYGGCCGNQAPNSQHQTGG
jgi:hypothetical protein